MEAYLKVRDAVGHPNAHAIGEMIQYLRTGKAAHAIAVIAWGGMDDPNQLLLAKWELL